MRRIFERLDELMAAVTFAEEGDVETARRIVRGAPRREDALDR